MRGIDPVREAENLAADFDEAFNTLFDELDKLSKEHPQEMPSTRAVWALLTAIFAAFLPLPFLARVPPRPEMCAVAIRMAARSLGAMCFFDL